MRGRKRESVERGDRGQGSGTEMNWFHSRVGSLRGMVSVTTQRGHDDLHPASVAGHDLLLFPTPPSPRLYYDAKCIVPLFYLLIKTFPFLLNFH